MEVVHPNSMSYLPPVGPDVFNPVHSWKHACPIVVTEAGMVMLVRFVHSEKHLNSIDVTESGMVTLVNPEQY